MITDINYKWIYRLASVNIKNIYTGELENEINIERIAVPKLLEKQFIE